MTKILGIDLGTTNSAMAVIEGGNPKILENSEGNRTTPSVVAKAKNGDILVGTLAQRQAVTNPKNTIVGVKRLIGHKYKEKDIQKMLKNFPYETREGKKGGVEIKFGDEWKRPEEISAMILQKLKTDAEKKLGGKVTEVVITVPAYFNDDQRQATKDAGEIAGLKVKRIINEPTAAALSYGFDKNKDQKIVVYDFGGGTFDISVLEVGDSVVEVKATGGDHSMGGQDINNEIIEYILEEFKKENNFDLKDDATALQRIADEVERAKKELSTSPETDINIPFIAVSDDGPKNLEIKLTRTKLEELSDKYISKSIEITKNVLKDSGFKVSDIDEIIMVGGQTRMPKIIKEVEKIFDGKKVNQSINPDEVVSQGAAIQAGILQGDVKDVLLLDVTPLSLGIETLGGVATKLIEKNTTIPTSASQVFSTAQDNQPSVDIHVVQGERPMAIDNKSLGRFVLDGIAPAPRGTPQVEVTFDIDANGILKVSAKDKATGKEQSIRIEGSSGLSDEEIEKMKEDAEKNAEEDKKKKEIAETRVNAEGVVAMAEKTLSEHKDKISNDKKKDLEEKITNTKKALEKNEIEEIKKTSEELSLFTQTIGQEIYAQAQKNSGTEKENAKPKEAEVVEESEDKKDDNKKEK